MFSETAEPIKVIILNEGQQEGLNLLLQWAENGRDDDTTFSFKGSAGTGKTTLLKHFLAEFRYRYATCVTAPTHKAKKVASRSTSLTAETIQALLGIKPNTDLDDFTLLNPIFQPLGNKRIVAYKLCIIDEASMLNAELFDLIVKTANDFGVKVLFVGDPLQLPPVKEGVSKAFVACQNEYELTKVMRQEGDNPMMDVLTALRYDILNDTDTALELLRSKANQPVLNEKGQGYIVHIDDDKGFNTKLIEAFQSEKFKANAEYTRFCSWTNATVSAYNRMLKNAINPSPMYLAVNDLITTYSRSQVYSILNSEDYIITSIVDSVTDWGIKVWRIGLVATDNPAIKTHICVVNGEGYPDFFTQHSTLLNLAIKWKGKRWVQYYEFKENHLLAADLKGNDGKLIAKKDIDYGYAITVHKTQGSTYDEVFIQGADINRNTKAVERRKLWYVACSRARNVAHITL